MNSYFHMVSITDVPLRFNRDQCMRLTVNRGVQLWNRRAVVAATGVAPIVNDCTKCVSLSLFECCRECGHEYC